MTKGLKIAVLLGFLVLAMVFGSLFCNDADSQVRPPTSGALSTGKASSGLLGGGFGGGSAPMLGGGIGVVAGPYLGFYSGGLSQDVACNTDSDITEYPATVLVKIVWTSALADSGHVRWDESGETTWNYVEEADADSTTHYVMVVPIVIDYTAYDYCVRTGSDDCWSGWSDTQTFYTSCGGNTLDSYDAYNEFSANWLKVDPVYKNKVNFRYAVKSPPGEWIETGWVGGFTSAWKVIEISSLQASSTYSWEYRMEDPCGEFTSWVTTGWEFTTDGSGDIE